MYKTFKDLSDLVFGLTLLILFVPVLLVLLLPYIFIGEKPLYFQKRVGLKESRFTCIKLKTLSHDTERSVHERRFKYGDFLRRTSLDEIPQLLNIVLGQMSFVGPRPLPIQYLPYFSSNEKQRFHVKPGLTGWAQVNGRTDIDWESKLAMDVDYVNKQSFLLDLKVLLKTFKVLFFESNRQSLNEVSFIDFVKSQNTTRQDIER